MLEIIKDNDEIIAIILGHSYKQDGVNFLTPDDHSFQLAYMNRKKGDMVPAHYHKKNEKIITDTTEVLLVRSGKMKVTLFSSKLVPLKEFELGAGDLILMVSGGHRFEMLEQTELVEIKQGPYISKEKDKHIFE